ncbi:MAG: acetyltransferase [Planctomycetota bacterium]
MGSDIVIIGTGRHADVVFGILNEFGENKRVLGFINADNEKKPQNNIVSCSPLLGNMTNISELKDLGAKFFHVACGDNKVRKELFTLAAESGLTPLTVIHPKAFISRSASIDTGSCICMGAIIGIKVLIHSGVIVNTGAIIDHDCCVGAFSHIAPGVTIAGSVDIGVCTFVATGARIVNNVKIGNNVIIGAGSVVLSDVPDAQTVAGVPAKSINKITMH